MGQSIALAITHLSLSGGRWQEEPANLCSTDAGAARLHLLALPAGPAEPPEALYGRLFAAMTQGFATQPELPAGVAAALQAGNRLLFERNVRADVQHQVTAGLACAAREGERLVVGLLGPVAAAGLVGGSLTLQPADSLWLSGAPPRDPLTLDGPEAPAGLTGEAEALLYEGCAGEDDLLLLLSANLARAVPLRELVPALSGDVERMREFIESLALGEDVAVLRLGQAAGAPDSAGDGAEDAPGEAPSDGGGGLWPLAPDGEAAAPAGGAFAPPVVLESVPGAGRLARREEGVTEAEAPPEMLPAPPPDEEPPGDEAPDDEAPPDGDGPAPDDDDLDEETPDDEVPDGETPIEEEPDEGTLVEEPLDEEEPDEEAADDAAPAEGVPAEEAPVEEIPADADPPAEPPWDEEEAEDDAPYGEAPPPAEAETSPALGGAAPRRPHIDLQPVVDGLRRGARRIIYTLEDWAVTTLPERIPERPSPTPAANAPAATGISGGGRALMLLAMAIPLIMLAVVMLTRAQYDAARRAQFGDIQAEAQALYDQAVQAADASAMRLGLENAWAATQEGLAISPGDEMLMSLQRRIDHKLDQINIIERVYTFYRLAELEGSSASYLGAGRIVVEGIDLYVLHRGGERVYRFLMNDVGDALQPLDSDPTLLQQGAMQDGVRVGELVDIAFMASGGQRTLSTFVALDRSGTMYAYNPQQGTDVLPVADSDTWLKPEAIGGYFGNLYVLDPLLNTILKYVPTDNAYTSPPTSYLRPGQGIDLTGAVDMAVDGNMYVLFADGQVLKFFDGERVPFSMNGLPSPMRSPSAIFVSGAQEPEAPGYVYVADAGNQRILQFDKSGNYIRQLMTGPAGVEMQDLRGLYVDEDAERLLVLSGSSLWYAKLPPLQAQ